MRTLILVLLAFMVFTATASAQEYVYRGDTYCEKASYKLGRGISNIVHSHTEIWHNWHTAYVDHGFPGMQVGIVQGLCKMTGRIVLGVSDVATFPITAGLDKFPIAPEIPVYF